jgi:hypothetical protein
MPTKHQPVQLDNPHLRCVETYRLDGGSVSLRRAAKMLNNARRYLVCKVWLDCASDAERESVQLAVRDLIVRQSHVQIELEQQAERTNGNTSTKTRKRTRKVPSTERR